MLKVQMPLMKYDIAMLAYWAARQDIITIAKFKVSHKEDVVYITPMFPDKVIDAQGIADSLAASLRAYAHKISYTFIRTLPTVADMVPVQQRRSTDFA